MEVGQTQSGRGDRRLRKISQASILPVCQPPGEGEYVAGASKPQRSATPQLGEVAGVGLQFAGAIVIFLFVGRWLDSRFGTEPWLLLVGVVVGAVGGFYSMYRQLVILPRERQEREGGR